MHPAIPHRPAFRSLDSFTQEEFARWLELLPPGDIFHYELLEGFIVREPPAGWPHGHIAAQILIQLGLFVRDHRPGLVFDSSQGFELATGDTVEPDISFVSNERFATLSKPIRGFLQVAPDLLFEVLSPSTSSIDRHEKKRIYQRNRVREYVLVDAARRSLTVFRLEGDAFAAPTSLSCEAVFTSWVLPGLEIPVAEVFADT